MTKSLMIPIQPQHAVNILNGKKTLELRTWIPKGYVGWIYAYVTKSKKYILYKYKDKYYTQHYLTFTDSVEALNSKVVFRFWFDEYIELEHYDFWGESYYWKNTVISAFELEKATCMSSLEMEEYAKCKTLYAWHIKQLEIFDKPKSLSEFYKTNIPYVGINEIKHALENNNTDNLRHYSLSKAPQSYQFVYVKENFK